MSDRTPEAGPTAEIPPVQPDAVDPLDELRTELEGPVDELPVPERVRRFEHANEVLARELALLDEV